MTADVLDLVQSPSSGYRELYYRWEHEQWEAGKIDLASDAAGWQELDPFERRHVADSVNWRRMRCELATTALVAFVDAAPTEEQQVFLTTQLADEARAGIFLDRVASDVLEESEQDMAARSAAATRTVDARIEVLLEMSLPAAAVKLRAAGDPIGELIAAVARYHLGVVGLLGLTEARALVKRPEVREVLPGIHRGLSMLERDSFRHVAFALMFLKETVTSRSAIGSLETALNEVLPRVFAALGSVGDAAPGMGTPEELQESASEQLAAWLRAVQLNVAAIA